MNNFLALLAFAVLIGFLAILVIHVPRLDLFGAIAVTVVLAGWDLYLNMKGNRA